MAEAKSFCRLGRSIQTDHRLLRGPLWLSYFPSPRGNSWLAPPCYWRSTEITCCSLRRFTSSKTWTTSESPFHLIRATVRCRRRIRCFRHPHSLRSSWRVTRSPTSPSSPRRHRPDLTRLCHALRTAPLRSRLAARSSCWAIHSLPSVHSCRHGVLDSSSHLRGDTCWKA